MTTKTTREAKKEFDNLAYRHAHSGQPDHEKLWQHIEHLLDQQRKEIMDGLNPKSKENQRSAKKLCNRWFKPTKKQSADYVVRNFGEVIKRLANE